MNQIKDFVLGTSKLNRKTYFGTGVALMLLKYFVDVGILYLYTGEILSPLSYLSPTYSSKEVFFELPPIMIILLGIWTMFFIWIGVHFSIRRLDDANKNKLLSILFFLPFLNYLIMILFALLPSQTEEPQDTKVKHSETQAYFSALIGAFLGSLITVLMIICSVYALGDYGLSLFVGGPFVVGLITTSTYNKRKIHSLKSNLAVIVFSCLFSGGMILTLALEGILCLSMFAPFALVLAILGGLLGFYLVQGKTGQHISLFLGCIILPLLAVSEPELTPPVREVRSEITINAPPEIVWKNVIAFEELPVVDTWFFEMGIAYPIRAKIEGEGVGAIRYCEFSTGPFVEPITHWEAPKRLSFDVTSQPPTMKEWGLFDSADQIYAPHITDSVQSHRGEFRLSPTDENNTQLQGSTWYHIDLQPYFYWQWYSDFLIQAIHLRVLNHIKTLSEKQYQEGGTL
jgi:uncharacterized membrane protein YhaH (DUF805 family)